MTTDDIKTILICVEMTDGSVRQVLTSKETKKMFIDLLGKFDDGLKLSEELMPFGLQTKDI